MTSQSARLMPPDGERVDVSLVDERLHGVQDLGGLGMPGRPEEVVQDQAATGRGFVAERRSHVDGRLDGRLVILRIRGSISRSVAFERDGDGPAWTAVSHEMAAFVPLRKSAVDDTRARIPVAGDGTVTVEAWEEQDIDRDALATALDAPGATQWTEVKFRKGDPWEWAYLWLATVLPSGISRMPRKRPGFTPHFSWGSMAALHGATLAYLTIREGNDNAGQYWEIGTVGHGPRVRGPYGPRRAPGPAHRPGPPVHRRQACQPPRHRLAEVGGTRDGHSARRPHSARLLPPAARGTVR